MATTSEICRMDTARLARRVAAKELSPVEVVDAVLDRLDRLDPVLHMFTTVVPDHARQEAKRIEADLAAGRDVGPLAGVPTGGAGAVGRYAVQLASRAGATVIATASTEEKRHSARTAGARHVVNHRRPDAVDRIAELAGPDGVARVVDVAFGANLPLTSDLVATGATIATYGSDAEPHPRLPFYRLMRKGVTIRTVLVFVMPAQALAAAVEDVTHHLEDATLTHAVVATYPLDRIAEAHRAVERGGHVGRIMLDVG